MSEAPPASPSRSRPRVDDGRLARGRRSRARIRAAARELFRERGFDGTTLRAIAARAGMGASSIYRHVRSKEELLVEELAALQEEAWVRFRLQDDRARPLRKRLHDFFDLQHALLGQDPDLTTIALRVLTHPEAGVARRVLALHDRSMGLLAEILQSARVQAQLDRDVDVVHAAAALFHVALGARLAWAHGLLGPEECRQSVSRSVELLLRGIQPGNDVP